MDAEAKQELRKIRDPALRAEKMAEAAQAQMQKLAGARGKIVVLSTILLFAGAEIVEYGISILTTLADKVKAIWPATGQLRCNWQLRCKAV
jgi:hypothetical protein